MQPPLTRSGPSKRQAARLHRTATTFRATQAWTVPVSGTGAQCVVTQAVRWHAVPRGAALALLAGSPNSPRSLHHLNSLAADLRGGGGGGGGGGGTIILQHWPDTRRWILTLSESPQQPILVLKDGITFQIFGPTRGSRSRSGPGFRHADEAAGDSKTAVS